MKLNDLLSPDVKAGLYAMHSSHNHVQRPNPSVKRVHRVAGGLMPSLTYVEPDPDRGFDVPRPPKSTCFCMA